VLAYK